MIIAITILAIAIATLVIGFALGVAYRKRSYEQALDVATQTATGIIETAKKEAAASKKEAIIEAKEENHRYRSEIESEQPIAVYEDEPSNIFGKFTKYVLEIGKESYIKRVIALPGEHVEIKDGKVYINGEELEEPYLQDGVVTDIIGVGFSDFVVPENTVFAMGDNRPHSTDCRAFGCIPLEKIESTVAIRIWPLNLWGKVD